MNRGDSAHAFGRGWQLEGLDNLKSSTGGMLWVQSAGDALWFANDGSGGFVRAAGDATFSTLVQNGDGTFTLTSKYGGKLHFNSSGQLTSRVDTNANTTSYSYTSGLLTQITDPFTRITALNYTGGRLTSITDTAGRTATLAYDANGRLSTVTQLDPDGAGPLTAPVWSFGYDVTTHQLTSAMNPLSQATTFSYGTHNRLTAVTHPDTQSWQLTPLQTIGLPTGETGNSLTAANPAGTVCQSYRL